MPRLAATSPTASKAGRGDDLEHVARARARSHTPAPTAILRSLQSRTPPTARVDQVGAMAREQGARSRADHPPVTDGTKSVRRPARSNSGARSTRAMCSGRLAFRRRRRSRVGAGERGGPPRGQHPRGERGSGSRDDDLATGTSTGDLGASARWRAASTTAASTGVGAGARRRSGLLRRLRLPRLRLRLRLCARATCRGLTLGNVFDVFSSSSQWSPVRRSVVVMRWWESLPTCSISDRRDSRARRIGGRGRAPGDGHLGEDVADGVEHAAHSDRRDGRCSDAEAVATVSLR